MNLMNSADENISLVLPLADSRIAKKENDKSSLMEAMGEIFPRSSELNAKHFEKQNSFLTSIVILTRNELRYTQTCLESIQKYTLEPHEIIVVDNGSSDGTVRWLRKFARLHPCCKIIENQSNLGFAKGCNQGIHAAAGETVVLLNNDTVVTEGWLSGLLECLFSAPDVGIVGPMTNRISGIQQVPEVGYDDLKQLPEFAKSFRERNRKRRVDSSRIVGFCMLFRKRLVQEIGGLDESFGTGNFEDDDFCLRSLLAGYRNLIAGDVFIHHFGSRSFLGNKIDYAASIRGNRKIFNAKWSRPETVRQYGPRLFVIQVLQQAESLQRKGQMDEAISMLTAAVRQNPTDQGLIHRLTQLLIAARRFQDAEAILQEIEKWPHARTFSLLGRCAAATGKEPLALEYAEKALSLDDHDVNALSLKGMLHHRLGEFAEAKRCFEEAIRLDPSDGEAYTRLGALQWEFDQREEALTHMERGFILEPQDADVAAAYHAAVAESENFMRAEPMIREASALYPDDRRLCFMYISVLLQLKKHASALAEIERALSLFGFDDGMLQAALKVREKVGPLGFNPKTPAGSRLSVCMIVKNEEAHIVRCLTSIKGLADEIVVVDTGSKDRTADVARVLGARVETFDWNEDFSAARNHALSLARGDWILVLDADEFLAPSDHPRIRQWIQNRKSKRCALLMMTRNYTEECGVRGWVANDGSYPDLEKGNGWFPSVKVRLFPRHPRIRFVYPVHEVVEPTLKKLGMPILEGDVPVHHYGYLDKARLIEKGKMYFSLGLKKLNQLGDDPTALRELARQAAGIQDYELALRLWERFLAIHPENAEAWMNAGFAALGSNRFSQAIACSKRALEIDPAMREAALNLAAGHWASGDLEGAEEVLVRLLAKEADYPPALLRIAGLRFVQGKTEEAFSLARRLRALGLDPGDGFRILCAELRRGGREELARLLLERWEDAGERGEGSGHPSPNRDPFTAEKGPLLPSRLAEAQAKAVPAALP